MPENGLCRRAGCPWGSFANRVVGGITDSWGLVGRRREEVSSNPQSSHEGFGHGERKVQVLLSCRRRRRLLQFVRRGHHDQGPQPRLRRPTEEVPPAGSVQTLSPIPSTASLPMTSLQSPAHRLSGWRAPKLKPRWDLHSGGRSWA